jgi:hypothetical protein
LGREAGGFGREAGFFGREVLLVSASVDLPTLARS